MSDWKNQIHDPKGLTRPEASTINFAVPDRKCLDDAPTAKKIRNIKPCVLTHMIQLVCDDDPLKSNRLNHVSMGTNLTLEQQIRNLETLMYVDMKGRHV
jgi:hypothetical protein